MRLIKVATCSLNQWALDFSGNYERIRTSILLAKQAGASFRIGPELEICGYGCNDHFYELDTFDHSWQVLELLLNDLDLYQILVDVGMPVIHDGIRYNCRVVFFNGKLLLIRPKLYLANDGNYRESRWFAPWLQLKQTVNFQLPENIRICTSQKTVAFGDGFIATNDVKIGFEICEELFTPQSPHIDLGFNGVDIIANGSGSHHELRKLKTRIDLIVEATSKTGGAYLYANQQGCDGERVYYDGSALIAINGQVVAQGSQFSLKDVEIVTACLDLDDVVSYRCSIASRSLQATSASKYPVILLETDLCTFSDSPITCVIAPTILSVEQEIELGPACWLWDYLRRSGMRGFFLALSGGIDSCATALIVTSMCNLVYRNVEEKNENVLKDIQSIMGCIPKSAKEIAGGLFCTCYMGTENSSLSTRERAKELASAVGSYHLDVDISDIVHAFEKTFETTTNQLPKYKAFGGSDTENLALQNIQARSRMVMGYLLAQLIPWSQGTSGSFLVLGSANVDECLRGYLTKYDCSSADLNPIGSISKVDLRRFVSHCMKRFDIPLLSTFLEATPSAELEPIVNNSVQSDEVDMGMTYTELSIFGRLRKTERCGPVAMFQKLLNQRKRDQNPLEILEKTKKFFKYYSINRHKMTTITPAYHAESYSPDDNRFDLRQFLYRTDWKWQFEKMDQMLAKFKIRS